MSYNPPAFDSYAANTPDVRPLWLIAQNPTPLDEINDLLESGYQGSNEHVSGNGSRW